MLTWNITRVLLFVLTNSRRQCLREYKDNTLDIGKDTTGCGNHGNFLALLDFRIKAGDRVLGEHLSSAARNATYTTNTIQNQIISVLAEQVKQ